MIHLITHTVNTMPIIILYCAMRQQSSIIQNDNNHCNVNRYCLRVNQLASDVCLCVTATSLNNE